MAPSEQGEVVFHSVLGAWIQLLGAPRGVAMNALGFPGGVLDIACGESRFSSGLSAQGFPRFFCGEAQPRLKKNTPLRIEEAHWEWGR